MRWLSFRAILFGFSMYLAVILALYTAFALDLPNPWWAMATVFLTQPSKPLVGAIWAKAFYRVIGTVIGATAAVAFVPNLSNSAELLVLGLATWIGFCVFGGSLDRTPRSYLFMLSGYTAALIGLTNANNPVGIFDVAVIRAEEIIIGVLAPALVQSVLFPRSVASALYDKLDGITTDARGWAVDGLRALVPMTASHRVAIGLTEINLMATDWWFEGTLPLWRRQVLWALEERLIALLPLITAVEDRTKALPESGAPAQRIEALADKIAAWVSTTDVMEHEPDETISDQIRTLESELGPESTWTEMLMASLSVRLSEFVKVTQECLVLAASVRAPTIGTQSSVDQLLGRTRPRTLHVDSGIALLSALVAASTVVACAAVCIAIRWEGAPLAVTFAAVCCSLFSTADDPTPLVRDFVVGLIIAVPLPFLYEFAVLPAIDGFVMLSVVLFPVTVALGLLFHHPKFYLVTIGATVGFSAGLALQPSFVPDLSSFLNVYIALVFGAMFALVGLGLVRVLPVSRVIRRILRAGWKELAALTTAQSVPDRADWNSRMLDRVGLLIPRLGRVNATDEFELIDAVRELRLGIGIIELRQLRASVGSTTASEIDQVLGELGTHFKALSLGRAASLSPSMVGRLDAVVAGILELSDPLDRLAGIAVAVGLRRTLFPEAPAYRAVEVI